MFYFVISKLFAIYKAIIKWLLRIPLSIPNLSHCSWARANMIYHSKLCSAVPRFTFPPHTLLLCLLNQSVHSPICILLSRSSFSNTTSMLILILILILLLILIFVTCANGGPICHSSWLLQLQLQLPLQLGHGHGLGVGLGWSLALVASLPALPPMPMPMFISRGSSV